MPDLLEKTEALLDEKDLKWSDSKKPLLNTKINKFTSLKSRVLDVDIQKLKEELRTY